MAPWDAWVIAVLGAATLVGTAILARHAKRNAATWFAIVALAAFATLQILVFLSYDLAFPSLQRLYIGVLPFTVAGSLGFALVYPGYGVAPRRAILAAWLLVFAATLSAWFLLGPRPQRGTVSIGMREVLDGFGAFAIPALLALAAWRSRPHPPPRSTTLAFAPFLFWTVNDALDTLVLGWKSDAFRIASDALQALGIALVVLLGGVAALRWARDRAANREAGGFALLVVGMFVVASVQFAPFLAEFSVHLITDSLVVVLLLYAVMRHRILDIDLKLRWTIRRGTVVALFVGAFFVVAQIAQSFLAEQGSYLVGGLAAGLMLFALRPLEKLAGRVADRAVPAPAQTTTESYLAYRRVQIYRAALEGTLSDGNIDPREARGLERLRAELGISLEEHDLLARELSAPSASA